MAYRALVVEDDRSSQRALRQMLEAEDFTVDTADDGGEAIQFLSRRDYSVVLLDIVLPTVNGTAVMEYLRDTNPAMLERVIVVTGLDVGEIRALFPTVCDALVKPILPARLRAVIRGCVEGSRPTDVPFG